MPDQLARGLFANFAPSENPFSAPNDMEDNLRLLHDVLARTPIAGRYWLFGGLLLSAVREGEIMLHDTKDADWGFLAADEQPLSYGGEAHVDVPLLQPGGDGVHDPQRALAQRRLVGGPPDGAQAVR